MGSSKKEVDISKVRVVRTNYKAFMAEPGALAGGGMSEEEIEDIMEAGKEAAEGAKDEATRGRKVVEGAIKAEAVARKADETKIEAMGKTLKNTLKRKMKDVSSKIPSTTKVMICLAVALAYDIIDGILTVISLGSIETVEWVGDIFMNAFLWVMLGKFYPKQCLIEMLIPGLDVLPFYTLYVFRVFKASRPDRQRLKQLKKEQKELKAALGGGGGGPAKKKGFFDTIFSQNGWAVVLGVTGIAAASIIFYPGIPKGFLVAPLGVLAFFALGNIIKDHDMRAHLFKFIIIFGLIGLIVGGIAYGWAVYFAGFGGAAGETSARILYAPQAVGEWFSENNPVVWVKNWYKKQIFIATGDYYTGKVDENAQAKLGVYLEDLKQADPIFYTDRPVIMFANLIVQTLDKPINVTLKCNVSKGLKSGVTPQIFPQDQFDVDIYEERGIDCLFPAESISKGLTSFAMNANFDFKTMAYVKSYFMDAERLRSMRREEIDPLEQYGIKEKSPTAIYTNGPIGIGMGVGTPPVGVFTDQSETTMTLGITIDNKWDGKLEKVNRFVIILPKGFLLEDIGVPRELVQCSELPAEEQEICDDEYNTVYIVDDDPPVLEKGNFRSYRAYIRMQQKDYQQLLGMGPISTHYFKVILEYTYSLEKKKTIEVKSRETLGFAVGAGADITGPVATVQDPEKVSNNSIRVRWTTSEESNDVLQWWDVTRAPPSYPAITTPNEAGFSESHERVLSPLSSGKTYGYKITSTDKNGNSAETPTRTYTMS